MHPSAMNAHKWYQRRLMRVARSHFASVAFQRKIYVFGGGGEGFKSLNSVEIYDTETDIWSEGREMPTTRSGLVGVLLNDRIYVMGGGFKQQDGTFRFLTTVEIYDPAKNMWEKGPDLLVRHDAPAATILNDQIYLFGGHLPDAKGGPLADPAFTYAERFTPQLGYWEEISPLPTPRFSPAGLSWNGKIWAIGGGAFTGKDFTNYDRIEIFDPTKGSWSEQPPLKLPWPSAGPGACVLSGRIYIFGGNNGEAIQRRVACYDPDAKQWLELPPLPEARVVMAAIPIDNSIYIIGGRDATGKAPVNTVFALTVN